MTDTTTSRRRALGAGLASLGLAAAAPARAADATPPSRDAPDQPLGIGIETWPYPGPVRFLGLVMAGERLRMAYMDFPPAGPANGRTVLLLHGKNFDSSYWSGPIAWLRASGFRVVVPDQVGFNKSAKPALDYTLDGLARNTLALADHLGVAQFDLVGHSTGGALAVRLATLAPDRVTRLLLEDPIGLVDYRAFIPPQTRETLVAAEHAYTTATYRAFIAHFFARLPPAAYEPFVTWRMRTTLSGEFDRFALAAALTYEMIYRDATLPDYPALAMPVLLTAGTRDRSAPLIGYATPEAKARMPDLHTAAAEVVRRIPRGRFVSFDDVGHIPHMEAPDAFRRAALEFLGA